MISILSPAKSLDINSETPLGNYSAPAHLDVSEKVIKKLRTLSKKKIGSLMNISKDLVELNAMRYQEWSTDFNTENSRPALLTFNGEVYRGIDNKNLSEEDLQFANNHVRIVSGLHGLLKPMDLIQPYRLEMGTSINVGRKKNLYALWSDIITADLNKVMAEQETDVLIDLASNEYSKAVNFNKINGRVITPVFKDFKNGEYKVIMTWAKNARGKMAGFMIRKRLTQVEDLKGFNDYQFNEAQSSDTEWVFTRD